MVRTTLLLLSRILCPRSFLRKSTKLLIVTCSTEDIYANIKTFHSNPPPPIYNMRHIHPVRESGPIPAYDGPWTMEDIKKLYG